MADPTTFAEFEAAGSKFSPPVETPPAEPEKVAAPEAAEEAPVEDASEEQAQAEPPKQPPKRKLTLQEETDRMVKRLAQARKELREVEQQKAAHTAASPPRQSAPSAEDDDKPPVMPSLSNFPGTLEQWESEMQAFYQKNNAHILKQYQKQQSEQQAKAAQQRVDEEYNAKLGEHRKAHPDFDEGLRNLPELPQLMVDICKQEGPELVQVLIDHPDETARIIGLAPAQQLYEMGRLASMKNGNGKTAEPSEEPEEAKPVKVPVKLGATGTTQSAAAKPNYGAKNFAEYEQLSQRFAQKRPGFVSRGK